MFQLSSVTRLQVPCPSTCGKKRTLQKKSQDQKRNCFFRHCFTDASQSVLGRKSLRLKSNLQCERGESQDKEFPRAVSVISKPELVSFLSIVAQLVWSGIREFVYFSPKMYGSCWTRNNLSLCPGHFLENFPALQGLMQHSALKLRRRKSYKIIFRRRESIETQRSETFYRWLYRL